MQEVQNLRPKYDLQERTQNFAVNVRKFIKQLSHTMATIEDGKQLIRSSGSVGANYIEANESLSKKDFLMRIKICRKEAKESKYWLELLEVTEENKLVQRNQLAKEANELVMIFNAIVQKTK
jgi:four helix bundle protein